MSIIDGKDLELMSLSPFHDVRQETHWVVSWS